MKIINKSLEVNISLVDIWQDNPRGVKDEDLKRLKKQITELGVYKPILCIKEGGRYTTIGGNMRLRALTELGTTKVWITEIEVKDEAEKVKISLSDNDRVGFYLPDELTFQIKDLDINLEDFNIGLDEFTINGEREFLKEQNISLKPYKRTHILLSFEPSLLMKIQKQIEQIKNVEGIEYEQSSN